MINFEIMMSIDDDKTESMNPGEPIIEYSNTVTFEEIPTEETIRNTLFGIFSEIYANALSEYGLIEIEDEDESNTNTSR